MRRLVYAIHNKSDAEKKKIAIWVSTTVTALVAFVWVITLPSQIDRDVIANTDLMTLSDTGSDSIKPIENNKGPFQVLGDSIGNSARYLWGRTTASVQSGLGTDENEVEVIEQVENRPVESGSLHSPEFLPDRNLDFLP